MKNRFFEIQSKPAQQAETARRKTHEKRSSLDFVRLIGFYLALVFGSILPAPAASVTTDRLDYPPGATAIITGQGWQPGETVTLQVTHSDTEEPSGTDHEAWTVVADAEGRLVGQGIDAAGNRIDLIDANGEPYTTWHVCEDDCLGATLVLTAKGSSGRPDSVAEAIFTDGPLAPEEDCTTCTSTGTPTSGPALVDGDITEWNTSLTGADFWASLYNAGRSDPGFAGYDLTANAFARYECDPDGTSVTVHLLVLTSDSSIYPVLVSPTDAWAAIGGIKGKVYTGASVNDGTGPDFAWVGVGYDGDASHALGYEASFKLPAANSPWSCFVIHVEVYNRNANAAQTSGTQSFNGPGKCLAVQCPPDKTPNDCDALSVSANPTAILCQGGSSTVTVEVTGGTAPYSGVGIFTVNAGTYEFTVTDANGCTATATATIPEPTPLVASSVATAILCYGGDSVVTVSANGGTGAYVGTGTFTVKAGTYSYVVTDANGCSSSTSVTVTEPTPLVASSVATAILCYGGDSVVTVSANGGTGPYVGTGTFTVKAGTYTYVVTDANGCSSSTSVTVTEPTPLVASSVATAILCYGGDSIVTVSANGGTGPYVGTGNFTVKAGTYTYVVTDRNGCSSSTSVTIVQPAAPVSVQMNSLVICLGTQGTLTATPSGGTGTYSYLWSTGATTPSISVGAAGDYSVVVWDANGCTAAAAGTVSYSTTTLSGKKFYDANANGANDDSQSVQGIKITLSGNGIAPVTTYTAADGSYGFAGLLPGTYTVTETLPIGTWVNTTPLSQTVVVGCSPVTGVNFGNLCRSTPINGLTLGFWSNSNGQGILATRDSAWRTLLNGYNLRNANGTLYTVPTGSFSTVYSGFRNWLLNATASNMAYMLSAQLSASVLNVAYNGLNGNTVLVVSPSLQTQAGAKVVNTLAGTYGFTVNASTGHGYITLSNLQAAAKASLLANGNTTVASAARTYQDCLKTLLDQSNNNGNPTGSSAYNVPLTVVSLKPSPFTYPY